MLNALLCRDLELVYRINNCVLLTQGRLFDYCQMGLRFYF